MDEEEKTREMLVLKLGELKRKVAELEMEKLDNKKNEEALREKEERYQALFEKSPASITVVDNNGFVVECNSATERLIGYPREEIIGKSFQELLTLNPRDMPKLQEKFQMLVRGEEDTPYELEIIRKDGSRCWILVVNSLVKRGDEVVGIQVISEDITDKKKAEDIIRIQRDLGSSLSAMTDLEEAITVCVETAINATGMDSGGVYLVDENTGDLELVFSKGLSSAFVSAASHYDADSPNTQLVMSGKPAYVMYSDLKLSPDVNTIPEGLRALAVIPLVHEDKVIGSLNIASHTIDEISNTARNSLESTAAQIGSAIARLQTEEALRESEERFRTAFDNAAIGRAMAEPGGTFINVNSSFCKILGYDKKELLEKAWMDVTHPVDLKESAMYVRQMMERERSSFRFEHRLIHKNENNIWVDLNVVLIRDSKEKPLYMIGDIVDITERKKAEEALKESERLLRESQEVAYLGSYVLDIPSGIWKSSDVLDSVFGIDGSFVRSIEGWTSLIHPKWQKTMVEYFTNDVIGNKGRFDKEYEIIRKNDGAERWVHGLGELEYDSSGQPIRMIGTVQDITDRKSADEALRESEEKHRTLFETMTQGVVYQDADGSIISANPAAEKILGLSLDQMQGRTSTDPRWKSVQEDGTDFPGDTHPSMTALRTGKEVRNVVMGVFNPQNESYNWININAVPEFKEGEDKPYRVYTTFEDITESKLAAEKIKDSLREKEVLLKEIHHRVKNNLQIISSMLSLQSMHLKDPDAVRLFKESQNRVNSMAFVHERMYKSRDIAKINFADYIKDLTTDLISSYGINSNEITPKISGSEVLVGIDQAIPCGLIINELVSNSLKHAFPGGRKGEIRIDLNSKNNEELQIMVSDNGVGFPENMDFRNTKTLGLQLVNSLVDQLEGKIEIDNREGTTFKMEFSLPGN